MHAHVRLRQLVADHPYRQFALRTLVIKLGLPAQPLHSHASCRNNLGATAKVSGFVTALSQGH
jgi:hypothetical protein